MNSFTLEIWDDEGEACTFYTVRKEGHDLNETDKFLERFEYDDNYKDAVRSLLSLVLEVIGDDYGALDKLFNRHENEVKGLPPKGKIRLIQDDLYYPDFPLRLYALKLRENLVVLFNGGIKDGETNQTSSLLNEWREACAFASKIDRAIVEKQITIDEENRKISFYDGSENIILF